jgi:cytochrome c-type biogenesis protein CcmE
MNSIKTLQKIKQILGLSPQIFFEAKTEQGIMMKMEGELELGSMIYVATEEGLIPAPAGEHLLMDGTKIEVDEDSKVQKIDMGSMVEKEEVKKEEESEEMFADVKLKDGEIMRVEGDMPSVGRLTKKVSYDGTLLPFTDGNYETTDGKVISIIGGEIKGIIEKGKDEAFVIAETAEGAKVESKTFDVGEEVYVIDGDTKTKAPDGEHQVVLKDESGNDVKIRVMTKDGIITERENVEEEDMAAEKIAELFSQALKRLENKIDALVSKQNQLETKVQKFAKEPAGERVFTQKTIAESKSDNDRIESFKRLRAAMNKN